MTTKQQQMGELLIKTVCFARSVEVQQIMSSKREKHDVCYTRQLIMSLAFSVLGFTLDDSAKLVNRNVHATARNANNAVKDATETDPKAAEEFQLLRTKALEIVKGLA